MIAGSPRAASDARTALFLEIKLGSDDASSSTPHANDAPGYTAIASSYPECKFARKALLLATLAP